VEEELHKFSTSALDGYQYIDQIHNSSDIPNMRYLKYLSANSGKKTTLYFKNRCTGLQNKTAFVV
jgi:hypothetical protein